MLDRARWSSAQLCNKTYWTQVKPEQGQPRTGDWNTVFHFRTFRSSCEPQNLPRFGRRASQKEPSNNACRKRDTSPERTRPASRTWARLRPRAPHESLTNSTQCDGNTQTKGAGKPKIPRWDCGPAGATCRRKRPLKHNRARVEEHRDTFLSNGPPYGGSLERLVKGNHDWFGNVTNGHEA